MKEACVISSDAASSFKSPFCFFTLSFFFNSPSPAGGAMAQLGAGWPKSLLQGIINSGVSQGRAVFIKLRQLNAVAA